MDKFDVSFIKLVDRLLFLSLNYFFFNLGWIYGVKVIWCVF